MADDHTCFLPAASSPGHFLKGGEGGARQGVLGGGGDAGLLVDPVAGPGLGVH